MLESFTCATFAPHLHDSFLLDVDGTKIEVELIEAEAVGSASAKGDRRAPFSIVFRAPPTVVVPQRIYGMDHPVVGAFELFLVPIGPDPDGMRYEAVFT